MSAATTDDLKARVRRSLPTVPLEQIRIASPCTVSWDGMQGDERSRHCGQCARTVHDLSAMSRAEAEALVSGGEKLCVRLWVRKDGTVLTADCPVGLAKLRRHLKRVGAIFGAFLNLLGLGGCTGDEPEAPPPALMGEMCVAPPTSASDAPPTSASDATTTSASTVRSP